MEPTVLVYSSHERCERIHRDWIVERALRGNRRVLFLPLSAASADAESEEHQRYNWDTFRWFFDRYRDRGLEAFPFFWHPDLRREDLDPLFDALADAEVVILGGGQPPLGMRRYEELGGRFHGDPTASGGSCSERQRRGLLTAGFSAGIDQLCAIDEHGVGARARRAGLRAGARRLGAATLRTRAGEAGSELARAFPECLVFGLPNDSGLAVSEGRPRADGRGR